MIICTKNGLVSLAYKLFYVLSGIGSELLKVFGHFSEALVCFPEHLSRKLAKECPRSHENSCQTPEHCGQSFIESQPVSRWQCRAGSVIIPLESFAEEAAQDYMKS